MTTVVCRRDSLFLYLKPILAVVKFPDVLRKKSISLWWIMVVYQRIASNIEVMSTWSYASVSGIRTPLTPLLRMFCWLEQSRLGCQFLKHGHECQIWNLQLFFWFCSHILTLILNCYLIGLFLDCFTVAGNFTTIWPGVDTIVLKTESCMTSTLRNHICKWRTSDKK